MNASTRKSIRTGIQATAAVLVCLGSLVPVLGLNVGKYAGVGAAFIALAAVGAKIQNALESKGAIKTVLDPAKAPPTPPALP